MVLNVFNPSTHSIPFTLSPPNNAALKSFFPFAPSFLYVSCRLLTSSHHSLDSPALQLLLHSDAAHRSRLGHGAPLYTARHPLGPWPVTGSPVTSRLAWADSDTGAAHPAQADSDPLPVSSQPGSGRLGSPAEHTARADPDPASSSVTRRRPQRLLRAWPCPPACLLATLRQVQ